MPEIVGSVIDERCRWALERQQLTEVETDRILGGWYSIRVVPSAIGLTVSFKGTSERHAAKAANLEVVEHLQIDEARYRRLVDGMAEGVAETTLSSEFVTVNNAFAVMFGYDPLEDLLAHVTNGADQYGLLRGAPVTRSGSPTRRWRLASR